MPEKEIYLKPKIESRVGPLLWVLVGWAFIVAASVYSYHPLQPPKSNSFVKGRFDTEMAMKHLKELVGDGIPHPAGSGQNAIVRERLISKLESFNYDVQVQTSIRKVPKQLVKRTKLTEVELYNIVAMRKGRRNLGKAIALVTHYDSHPAGPGACDDGVGLAAMLEIARLYSEQDIFGREVMFVITDGEEFGLLGAKAFCEQNPVSDEISVVVNLEARGTAGPSLMFETSPMSRELIPLFAKSSPKPHSSSLFREIYKRLPNNTDFTVFTEHGKLGFNFAFIGDVKNYHTPADNFENVDENCLRHHGENAIALMEAIGASERSNELIDADRKSWPKTPQSNEAVYFDLFGTCLIWWPANYSLWMTAVAAGLFVVAVQRTRVSNLDSGADVESSGWLKAIGCQAAVCGVVIGFGILLSALVRYAPQLSHPWPSQPTMMLICFWFASFAIIGGAAVVLEKGLTAKACLYAWVCIWLAFALGASTFLAGASFLFLVPVLLTTICMATYADKKSSIELAVVIAALASGLIWLPLERLFYDAVGFKMAGLNFFRIAMMGTGLLGVLSFLSARDRFAFSIMAVFTSVLALMVAFGGSI